MQSNNFPLFLDVQKWLFELRVQPICYCDHDECELLVTPLSSSVVPTTRRIDQIFDNEHQSIINGTPVRPKRRKKSNSHRQSMQEPIYENIWDCTSQDLLDEASDYDETLDPHPPDYETYFGQTPDYYQYVEFYNNSEQNQPLLGYTSTDQHPLPNYPDVYQYSEFNDSLKEDESPEYPKSDLSDYLSHSYEYLNNFDKYQSVIKTGINKRQGFDFEYTSTSSDNSNHSNESFEPFSNDSDVIYANIPFIKNQHLNQEHLSSEIRKSFSAPELTQIHQICAAEQFEITYESANLIIDSELLTASKLNLLTEKLVPRKASITSDIIFWGSKLCMDCNSEPNLCQMEEKSLLSVPVENLYTSKSANSSPILLRKSENSRDDNKRTHSLLDTSLFLQVSDKSTNLANNLIIIKEGEIEKSKIVELNKKPKKWMLNAYACLTKRSFYLFESKEIFELLKSGRKDKGSFNIKIDVKSCEIKTKSEFRKNTLIIVDTKTGSQVLIQNDKSKQVEEWQSAILQTSSVGVEERPKTLLGLENAQILGNPKDQTKIKNKLKNFFGGGRPSTEDLTKTNSPSKEEVIFGGELEKMCELIEERPKVPYFVRRCIQVIEPYIGTDGLYRASGNSTQIQKIRSEINQHNYDILDTNTFDVHVLTGALKLFFRELKVTLIPNSEYSKCLQMSEEKDKGTIASELKKSLLEFPISHQDTLKFLMQHLLDVSKHEKENRMDISNLATIWAPNLLQTGLENIDPKYDAFYQCSLQMRIIQIYLTNFTSIFGDI